MEFTSNNSSGGVNEDESSSMMSPVERNIKFYSLLTLQTPALFCSIFIFYHFKWRRLQNQIYGFLLIVNALINAVELSFTLHFLHVGSIYSESRCAGWITLNYSLFQLSIFLMTWTSIERYLFIYHERFIMRHIILLHYGPTLILFLYCSVLCVGIVVSYTCHPKYDVHLYICGGPCYSSEPVLGMFDWVGNGMSMEVSTFIINVILIIRHLIQRHRMKRAVLTAAGRQQWHRSVKLCIQLIGIAMLDVICWIPYSAVVLIQMSRNSEQLRCILSTFFAYLPYLQSLLLPYVCILFMPEIKDKFVAVFTMTYGKIKCRKNRVHAINNGQNPRALRLQPATIPYPHPE